MIKVYLDTSVISYLYQLDAPDKMLITQKLWKVFEDSDLYDIYISDVVLNEISKCNKEKLGILIDFLDKIDYNIIETNENIIELAEKFIDFDILKQKSFDDCQHIAAAILNDCDIIISWNFKHIVNDKTVEGVKIITTLECYKDILIYPPNILLEEEADNNDETDSKLLF